MKNKAITIAGHTIKPGEHHTLDIPAAQLYTHAPLNLPVVVMHGKKAGPTMLVTAAIHGDEINGVEIIRRLVNYKPLKRLKGTLILAPVVNVFGFIQRIRYLPDRRDLNRSFPGSEKGSLASRIAHLVKTELVDRATHIIDLHTGAIHRSNLPQLRTDISDEASLEMAKAFNPPVIIDSSHRRGSLRNLAHEYKKCVITYEGGEALRFEEKSISIGFKGILNSMRSIGMLAKYSRKPKKFVPAAIVKDSSWVRAPVDGVLRPLVALGASVIKGQKIGIVSDPFGQNEEIITAPFSGIVIGRSNLPLVNEGEAYFNIAKVAAIKKMENRMHQYHTSLETDNEFSY